MDAYIFNADLICAPCGEAKRLELNRAAIADYTATRTIPYADEYGFDPARWLRQHPRTLTQALGFDPEDESAYDSGDYPKGPTANGGGEADTAQHCGQCGTFLENALTEDGEKHVIESLISFAVYGDGNRDVLQTWYDFYHVNAFHGGLDANTVADAILETIGTRLDFATEYPNNANDVPHADEADTYRENALFVEGQNGGSTRAINGQV